MSRIENLIARVNKGVLATHTHYQAHGGESHFQAAPLPPSKDKCPDAFPHGPFTGQPNTLQACRAGGLKIPCKLTKWNGGGWSEIDFGGIVHNGDTFCTAGETDTRQQLPDQNRTQNRIQASITATPDAHNLTEASDSISGPIIAIGVTIAALFGANGLLRNIGARPHRQ
jgi:hypothetical protein